MNRIERPQLIQLYCSNEGGISWGRMVNALKNQSNRVCAVNISMNSYNILLCNVYLPVYNMPVNTFIEGLNEVFNHLSSLINGCNVDHVVIGGDFNTSFSRKGHNTDLLLSFMDKEYIHCGLEYSESSVDFTFERKSSGSRSIIDHFLLSETLIKNVLLYESVHDNDNFSDHSPYYDTAECASFLWF